VLLLSEALDERPQPLARALEGEVQLDFFGFWVGDLAPDCADDGLREVCRDGDGARVGQHDVCVQEGNGSQAYA
jgi:hypothetical protein